MTPEDLKHIEKIVSRAVKKWAPRDCYTFQQVGHRLGIDSHRVRRDYILTGRLGFVMLDGQMKIPSYELENFLKSNTKYYNPLKLKKGGLILK